MPAPKRNGRLWLPLLIIGKGPTFVGKTRLQKLAYLIQCDAKLDLYDFRRHYFGPFSRDLDNDIVCHADLVEVNVHPSIMNPDRAYYEYSLTDEGQRIREQMERGLDRKRVDLVKGALDNYFSMSYDQLLEQAYATFASIDERLKNLESDTGALQSNVEHVFNSYCNRQSLFLLTVLNYMQNAIERSKALKDDVQKAVIARLAAELLEACKEAVPEIAPPVDSDRLRPTFMNIADIWGSLIEYCEKRGVVKNPFKVPLEEVLSRDDAVRLRDALQSIELKM